MVVDGWRPCPRGCLGAWRFDLGLVGPDRLLVSNARAGAVHWCCAGNGRVVQRLTHFSLLDWPGIVHVMV